MEDAKLERINRGQRARIIRNDLEARLFSQEDDIVARLVDKYVGGTLTDTELRGSIGEIAALRRLSAEIEVDISRGLIESQEEHGDGKEVS